MSADAYDVNRIGATRFWRVRNEPYADEVRYADGWYWQDDDCEEPMGPFDSEAEAQAACFIAHSHNVQRKAARL